MTASLAAAQDALARLDDGGALPGDTVLAEIFDRHCKWDAQRICLICGGPNGPECDRCVIDHDDAMRRAEDV
jgi:hypothetical protein